MRHTQLTDDLQEQATLYAAGAMTDDERAEYSRHLEDDECPVCRAEVRELQAAASMLAFSAPEMTPSPRVRERLMEQARSVAPPRLASMPAVAPRLHWRWLELLTSAVAVGAILVAVAASRANTELRHLSDVLNSRIAQLEVQLTESQNYIAQVTSPQTRVINLAGQALNVQAAGRIFWDVERKKWFMYVKDLPQAPSNMVWELWFVPKNGTPVRSTVFNTSGGSAELQIDVPEGIDLKAAAVTNEPGPSGTDQPTGQFALLGAM